MANAVYLQFDDVFCDVHHWLDRTFVEATGVFFDALLRTSDVCAEEPD